MTASQPEAFASALVARGVLIPTSVEGVYGEGAVFAAVTDALSFSIRSAFGQGVERMRFASVMPRLDVERIGYFRNFPHLLGTLHCFCGDEAAHRELVRTHDAGGEWTSGQAASDLVLIPAACYPVYPALAARGEVPAEGWLVQVEANCFRREPSRDPVRLQTFHMLEFVRVGTPDQVLAFREAWMERGLALFARWGLGGELEQANDPFFGRAAVVMAKSQRGRELKFELVAPVSDDAKPTACMSFNYHLDSFGQALGLRTAVGEVAHSACIGFGMERVALALFRRHGLELEGWPLEVRKGLGLG